MIEKYKARPIVQGFKQTYSVGSFDIYAPLAWITTIRLLVALEAIHNIVIHQMDFKITFLKGELEEEVYINNRARRRVSLWNLCMNLNRHQNNDIKSLREILRGGP